MASSRVLTAALFSSRKPDQNGTFFLNHQFGGSRCSPRKSRSRASSGSLPRNAGSITVQCDDRPLEYPSLPQTLDKSTKCRIKIVDSVQIVTQQSTLQCPFQGAVLIRQFPRVVTEGTQHKRHERLCLPIEDPDHFPEKLSIPQPRSNSFLNPEIILKKGPLKTQSWMRQFLFPEFALVRRPQTASHSRASSKSPEAHDNGLSDSSLRRPQQEVDDNDCRAKNSPSAVVPK